MKVKKKRWIKRAKRFSRSQLGFKQINIRAFDWDLLWESDGASGVSPENSLKEVA